MSWVRIDEYAPYHPKVIAVGLGGFGLFCASLCYANKFLTDGFIPVGTLSAVYPGEKWGALVKLAVKLVEAGLWEKKDDGWTIHDYHQYQPTKEEVLEERRRSELRYSAGGRARASMASRIKGRFMTASVRTSDLPALPPAMAPPIPPASTSPATAPASTPEEKQEALSGSRPTRPRSNGFSEESKAILQWLNDKGGKHFRPVAAHLRLIDARLKDHEPWVLRKVVTMKVQEWKNEPKSKVWLRPNTLFNETNFENYVGELPAGGDA